MRKFIGLAVAALAMGVLSTGSAEAAHFGAARHGCCPTSACRTTCETQCATEERTVYETVWEKQEVQCMRTVCETVWKEVEQTCYRTETETQYREVTRKIAKPV